jgi:hypothetical protein
MRPVACSKRRAVLDLHGPGRRSPSRNSARRRLARRRYPLRTGPSEQKAVNLRGNQHVILTTGRNEWDRGTDVVVEGDAVQTTDDGLLRRVAEAWTTKWDGRCQYEAGDGGFDNERGRGGALVFSVTPTKILAFTKGCFSQTSYRL